MFALPETITRWRKAGNDGFGRAVWSEPVSYPARIAYRAQEFTDSNGDRQVSTAMAYTEGDVKLADYIVFGASTAISPPPDANDIKSVSQTPSGAGPLKKAWFA